MKQAPTFCYERKPFYSFPGMNSCPLKLGELKLCNVLALVMPVFGLLSYVLCHAYSDFGLDSSAAAKKQQHKGKFDNPEPQLNNK